VEKLHQDAVQGKLRTKRRDRGIGFDEDSDNDEEDEHNRRIRRGMNKKRKIDGDTLEDLGKWYSRYKSIFGVNRLPFYRTKRRNQSIL